MRDASLRHTLQFGIGLHHAGLNDTDRSLVERLFVECKIQVWGKVWAKRRAQVWTRPESSFKPQHSSVV